MAVAPRKRLLLFDWDSAGHHETYLEFVADALGDRVDVTIAAPDESVVQLRPDLRDRSLSLGPSRMAVGSRLGGGRALADEEVRLLKHAIREAGATHALHMFADRLLLGLLRAPPTAARLSLLVFRPRLHYPLIYRSPLRGREYFFAAGFEVAVRAWRAKRDAHRVLSFDPGAVRLWNRLGGAPAVWLPEAPLPAVDYQPIASEIVIFGKLAARKGIRQLADAVCLRPFEGRITLFGRVDPAFAGELAREARRMTDAGAEVTVVDHFVPYEEALGRLAGAKCVAIPYPRHYGSSRLLVEASLVGTPVVATEFGLIGHLVRSYGLGVTADQDSPGAWRAAMDRMLAEDRSARTPQLQEFARLFTPQSFRAALGEVVAED